MGEDPARLFIGGCLLGPVLFCRHWSCGLGHHLTFPFTVSLSLCSLYSSQPESHEWGTSADWDPLWGGLCGPPSALTALLKSLPCQYCSESSSLLRCERCLLLLMIYCGYSPDVCKELHVHPSTEICSSKYTREGKQKSQSPEFFRGGRRGWFPPLPPAPAPLPSRAS